MDSKDSVKIKQEPGVMAPPKAPSQTQVEWQMAGHKRKRSLSDVLLGRNLVGGEHMDKIIANCEELILELINSRVSSFRDKIGHFGDSVPDSKKFIPFTIIDTGSYISTTLMHCDKSNCPVQYFEVVLLTACANLSAGQGYKVEVRPFSSLNRFDCKLEFVISLAKLPAA